MEQEVPELKDETLDQLSPFVPRLQALLDEAGSLEGPDAKAEKLLELLAEKGSQPRNKVLLFTGFLDTLAYLNERCSILELRVEMISGKHSSEEQQDRRYRFALPKENPEAIDVLLSSEIGCEGLDYQFCDFMVNYDLPWNPMKIEQRIGRIDRRGQESDVVQIVNLLTQGTIDEKIYQRCLSRIGVFEDAIGGNEIILAELGEELAKMEKDVSLTSDEQSEKLRILSDNKIRDLSESARIEEESAHLFGLQLPDNQFEQEVENADNLLLSPTFIENLVSSYLRCFVGKKIPISGQGSLKVLSLSGDARLQLRETLKGAKLKKDHARNQFEKWLKGSEPKMRITFDPEAVQEERGLTLIDLVHPLVKMARDHFGGQNVVHQLNLTVPADQDLAAGRYPYQVYCWDQKGERQDCKLHAVSTPCLDSRHLLGAILRAASGKDATVMESGEREDLETTHYEAWTKERDSFLGRNETLVGQRIHSLNKSHAARRLLIVRQRDEAEDEKIRLMKERQLKNAETDFENRINSLKENARLGDIHHSLIAQGILTVEPA